jgi:hypothetical protein
MFYSCTDCAGVFLFNMLQLSRPGDILSSILFFYQYKGMNYARYFRWIVVSYRMAAGGGIDTRWTLLYSAHQICAAAALWRVGESGF